MDEDVTAIVIDGHTVHYPKEKESIVKKYKWRIVQGNPKRKGQRERMLYAARSDPNNRTGRIFMHRDLYPEVKCIHHRDKNGLNNAPSNISTVGRTKRAQSLLKNIQWYEKTQYYYVRMVTGADKKRVSKCFSVAVYESKEKARMAAIKWRNEQRKLEA